MNKLKVMTIIGTRPEIIRLSEVIKACDRRFKHLLVHTGQNYDYELNQIFFEDLSLREPDYYLNCAGSSLGETLGNVINKSYQLLQQEQPDALLILGDTNSSLAAISAKRLKIPIFHMEAGNRCGDWNVPETINRKIVDHIADFNLPYTDYAYNYLVKEGLDERYIKITGSPLFEVITNNINKINTAPILNKLGLTPANYLVLSMHREENVDHLKNYLSAIKAINDVADCFNLPIIFPVHPRTLKLIKARKTPLNPLIKMIKPLSFTNYCHLQQHALLTISDSGTVSEESAMLRFRAILFRTSTERPEAIEANTIIMSGIDSNSVLESIKEMLKKEPQQYIVPVHYTYRTVSEDIVNIIKNNISFINQTIWKKD